jgi:CheY-like chemotaxis protein
MTVDEQTAPATAEHQTAAQAVAEGARAYLLKPFDASHLT